MLYYGNTLEEIMKAFGLDILFDPHWQEFQTFWLSLTQAERYYYRYAKL